MRVKNILQLALCGLLVALRPPLVSSAQADDLRPGRPTGSGGGVGGDGTGITSASAFRTALGLGTAATVNTGIVMGAVPILGVGATLPAISGANLIGITASQISGLGTAALQASTAFQASDATLTAFADATCSSDRLLYCSGSDAVTSGTLTAAGRALLDDADASAQRTTLGLGTAATSASTAFQTADATLTALAGLSWSSGAQLPQFTAADTVSFLTVGSSANNIVQLDGSARYPAADGSLITNTSPWAADVWTYTWTPADGDPIATGGWTAVQSAATASTTVDSVACYSVTPSGASGESLIYKNVGAASSTSWEARVLLWSPTGNSSRYGWMYDSGIGTTDALFKVTVSGTTTPLRVNEVAPTVPALQYSGRWVMWTLRCYYNLSTTQTCELYAGRMKLYTFESAAADTAVSAGRLSIGRTIGAIVTAGCMAGVWVRSTGVNEAPVEYRERARTF